MHCLPAFHSFIVLTSLPPPPNNKNRLDRIYTLTDAGFREVIIVEDHEGDKLPACFPDTYGDAFEKRLLEELEASNVPTNYAPGV